MPRLIKICPHCNKTANEVSHEKIFSSRIIHLDCGHLLTEDALAEQDEDVLESLRSSDGFALRPYQIESIKRFEQANGRILFAHEMGLGKTPIALVTLKLHPEMLPALIICKSSLLYQWQKETIRWIGKENFPQILSKGDDTPFKMFKIYITSFDLVGNMLESFKAQDIALKTIVIDECQMIKNQDAKRTKNVQNIVDDKPYLMALSGTPIKNNAAEYFPILNMLRPELFPSYAGYCHNWLDTYNGYKGRQKVAGLKRWRVNEFHETTKEFIFRKTRAEAAPELPAINRQFIFYNIGEDVKKAYLRTCRELDEFMTSISSEDEEKNAGKNMQHILAYLNKMRYLTGMAKIEPVAEYVEEFLENNPDKKLTLFHHHHDVGRMLESKLKNLDGLIRISENDSIESNDKKIQAFTGKDEHRLLIARTLAEGEGLNLQACSNAIIMERQWNPANEAQAEARFARIGSTAKQIDVVYPTATDTIDEYFAELVEKKRAMMSQVLDNEIEKWNESSLMLELAKIVTDQGRRLWTF